MIDSKTTSNTYDKSTLDEKFKEINDKLSDLTKSLSSCVTKTEHSIDVTNAINTALGTLPRHYVTYEELKIYLKDYITSDTMDAALTVSPNTVRMTPGEGLGLSFNDNNLSLYTVAPYIPPVASISVTPSTIEYDHDSTVHLTVDVDNLSKIKKLVVTGGTLVNIDVTEDLEITDIASNTEDTLYILAYTDEQDNTRESRCSTKITRRILYGSVEPTSDIFSTTEKFESYEGITLFETTNPSTITINQDEGEYGWIATPWPIKSFTDISINFPGGWQTSLEDRTLMYTLYDSPYSDGLQYYVYRTANTGIGTVTWKITNN